MTIIDEILEQNEIQEGRGCYDLVRYLKTHNYILKKIGVLNLSEIVMSFLDEEPNLFKGFREGGECPYLVLRYWKWFGRVHVLVPNSFEKCEEYFKVINKKYNTSYVLPKTTIMCTCFHNPIKWNNFIVNPKNLKTFILGSSCVKNFFKTKLKHCKNCNEMVSFESKKIRCRSCNKNNKRFLDDAVNIRSEIEEIIWDEDDEFEYNLFLKDLADDGEQVYKKMLDFLTYLKNKKKELMEQQDWEREQEFEREYKNKCVKCKKWIKDDIWREKNNNMCYNCCYNKKCKNCDKKIKGNYSYCYNCFKN